MITFFQDDNYLISQNTYDEYVKNLPLKELICPHCSSSGQLIRYGRYIRKMKVNGIFHNLSIQRLRCKTCGHTHALLASFIIPYSQISLEDHVEIVSGNTK